MKKIVVLLLALCLIFGLSATAWAADEIIDVSSTPNTGDTIGYNGSVDITVNIPPDVSTTAPNTTAIKYTLTSTAGVTINHNRSSGVCTLTVSAAKIRSLGGTVNFTLIKEETVYDADGNTNGPEGGIPAGTASAGPFNKIATQVTLGNANITVSCTGGHSFSVTGSGPFKCTVPIACGSTTDTISIVVNPASGLSASSVNSLVANSADGAKRYVTISNGITSEDQEYEIQFTKATPSTNTGISKVELKTGSASGTTVASATGSTRSISVGNSYTSALYIVATPSDTKASASVSQSTITLTNAGTAYSFSVTVTAESGATQTYDYTATRDNSISLLSNVNLAYSSTTLGSVTNVVSTTTTRSFNINTTNSSVTLSMTAASGATIVSYKWGSGTLTTVNAASKSASVSPPAAGATTQLLVNVKVTATSETFPVYINITNNATTTNTLSSLYIKDRVTTSTNSNYLFDISPSFSSSKKDYTVTVGSDVDTIYIYPSVNGSASLTVGGTYSKKTDKYSANGYYQIDLYSNKDNKVELTVGSGSTSTKYTLTIEREENVEKNASLESLKISKSSSSVSSGNLYTMTPSFSYSKTKYEVDLAKSVSEVYLHFSTYHDDASYTVSGATKVSDGVYKATLTTNKTKTVTIKVTYKSDTTTYTINLNSGVTSRYALLTKIRVAKSESTSSSNQYTVLPSFDSSVLDYVALVPSGSATYVWVQATLDDTGDTLTVDGESAESGDWLEVSIKRGNSTSVPIKVKDDDGNTTTYDLILLAAPKSGADDDATLSSLKLQTGSSSSSSVNLDSTFSKNTTSYSASVANSVEKIRVYAEANDSSAWVLVNDVLLEDSYVEVELDEGKNTIKVVGYAEDCETSKTYTLTVNRGTGGADSLLTGLEARYGSSANQTLNLIPAFDKNVTNYKINVDGNINQIAFKPTVSDSSAIIRIMGKNETSGQWTSYNALNNGKNTFMIIITAGDGKTTTYYTVEVERGLSVVVSGQGIKVNGTGVTSAAYNINGNNYFKLRDIAYALRGTAKSFDVGYNSTSRVVSMTSGRNYSIIGGEMVKPLAPGKYQLSNQTVTLDGRTINLTAYNVDGNNYFMLREIGALFDFGVEYDSGSGNVLIDSSKKYTPE